MHVTVKKLTLMAALTAAALTIFIIEAQIPLPIPIPGAKLGLANVVTLFALFFSAGGEEGRSYLTGYDAFMILICRIILGAVFAGRITAFIYSLAGGILAFGAQAILKRIVTKKQIWACGATGAIFHNVGQILAAMLVTGTPSIAAYLPLLTVIGIVTGVFTGIVAQMTITRLEAIGTRK